MTLDQLRALQGIVEGGSLRAAAEILHRTQPTISVSIKNLEKEFGLQIFARDQYRNRLTPEGQALYEKAKSVLREAASLESLSKQLAVGEEAEVGVAFDSAIPVELILKIVKQCKSEYPMTRLNIFSENAFGSLDRVNEGKAAIAVLSWLRNMQQLESFPFMKLRMIPVIAEHLLPNSKKQSVPIELIRSHAQVVISDSSRNPIKEKFGVLEGGDRWTVNDYATKKRIILQGMGWGGLPAHLIQAELEEGLLVPVKLEGVAEPNDVSIRVARLRHEETGPVARRIWQLFRNNIPAKSRTKK